jgi:hypothetical protein
VRSAKVRSASCTHFQASAMCAYVNYVFYVVKSRAESDSDSESESESGKQCEVRKCEVRRQSGVRQRERKQLLNNCSTIAQPSLNKKKPLIAERLFFNKYGSYLLSRIVVQYHWP